MKNLFLTGSGVVRFDTETQKAAGVDSDIMRIRRIFLITEPTRVVYSKSTGDQEVYAEAGDIVIEFYDSADYHNNIVVAKSAQWADNIQSYRDAEQKRKEEWAAAKNKQACEDSPCEAECGTCTCPPKF